MNKYLRVLIIVLLFSSLTFADDLYKVKIQNQQDADNLNLMRANPILQIESGYILLIPGIFKEQLSQSNIEFEIIKSNITRKQLYLQSTKFIPSIEKQNILYSKGEIHLISASQNFLSTSYDKMYNISPVPDRTSKVKFIPQSASSRFETTNYDGLDTLIDKISQDSLESYLYRLEAFTHRLTGTDSCYAARDWLENKFREFGYDSVVIDPFIGSQLWARVPVQSYNVIATKVGTKYPDQQIIIGSHFDAVPDCPGADDNGSGTAAVLEMARIFKNIETDKTIIFAPFDSEESWMWGSYHYADSVAAENANIIVMLNVDMIGHYDNDTEANLYTGDEHGYATLWSQLSDSLVNINGIHMGSTASDHLPFQDNGYDVVFVQERNFSTFYHQPNDSTTYINFDYMTRMTKGTFATALVVDRLPSPVSNLQISQPGDGHSLLLSWNQFQSDISHFYIYSYKTSNIATLDSILVSNSEFEYLIENLDEGDEYSFYVKAFDYDGNSAIAYDIITGTPNSIPETPKNLTALPQIQKIALAWEANNTELDFDHYNIYRDSTFLISVTDTFYIDNSPSLGSELHEYYIVAEDTENKESLESNRAITRIAILEPNRILALNRSSFDENYFVNEVETGLLLREALDGYNFDYYSDTAYIKTNLENGHFNLHNMLDYGIVIIGAESAGTDDIASTDLHVNLAEYISYYLSLGGKMILFGRWSDNSAYINYNQNSPLYRQMYSECFNLSSRINNYTSMNPPNILSAELIGAKSQLSSYPNLSWDSSLTQLHASPFISPDGIPFSNYVTFNSSDIEVIYRFDSHTDTSQCEDQPVAWKNVVGPNKYVYFDIPLSFFDRSQAITALQVALDELLDIPTDINDPTDLTALPKRMQLNQNYPNPFNPNTTIEFSLPSKEHISLIVYNIIGQKVTTLLDKVYPAGSHKIEWDGTNSDGDKVSSGMYLYKLVSDDYSISKKMLLLK